MARDPSTKDRLLSAMAAHVLTHGLNDASLRPLARAAGTSDRMLIYHFGSKEGLIAELLTRIGAMFRDTLDHSLPPGRFASDREGVLAILGLMRSEGARGFMRVWFDILAASARGSLPHRETGRAILHGLQHWLAARLPEGTPDPATRAGDLLTRIEGIMVAEEVGLTELVEAAVAQIGGGADCPGSDRT